ncbi:endo-1,4-beta-xylanase [Candidatus Saccharibacteria bacterium]|nr:endo-1,4-beta-xylanase [Candidatus Saccharibacteria bacterium]
MIKSHPLTSKTLSIPNIGAAAAAALAIITLTLLIVTHAATQVPMTEAEVAVRDQTSVIDDPQASAGQALLFGSAAGVPTDPGGGDDDGEPTDPGGVPVEPQQPGKLFLGAAVEPDQLSNPQFTSTLEQYKFTSLTAENAMKFGQLQPNQGQFNWGGADAIVNYAQSKGMRVRGHTLIWHRDVPGWVNGLSSEQAATALKTHIQQVMGRYKGKIAQWDVANEVFNDDGTLRDTVWLQKLGNDYLAQAYTWAHEADPSAQLYYNDYSAESGESGGSQAKVDAVYNMVKSLKERGVPIHGVGLQMHAQGGYPGSGNAIKANMQRLGTLGVKAELTELDIVDVADQAGRYAEYGRACKEAGNCTAVTTWGLYDGHTWRPGMNPLLFDGNFQPKPAYEALTQAMGL